MNRQISQMDQICGTNAPISPGGLNRESALWDCPMVLTFESDSFDKKSTRGKSQGRFLIFCGLMPTPVGP